MVSFRVSRRGRTIRTLHGGADATASRDAAATVATELETLAAEDGLSSWEVVDAAVHEPPTAPFEPYDVAVDFAVAVAVEAEAEADAAERGAAAIDAALSVPFENVEFAGDPDVRRTG